MAESETNGFDPMHYLGFLPGAESDVNLLKQTFYSKVVSKGLGFMYKNHFDVNPDSPILKTTEKTFDSEDDVIKTKNPKHILIVGAGMSGLAAAYELKRAGHKVRKSRLLLSFFVSVFVFVWYKSSVTRP